MDDEWNMTELELKKLRHYLDLHQNREKEEMRRVKYYSFSIINVG